MAKKARSEEQILRALHQAESGERVADICRDHGISQATFYVWKKKYGRPSERICWPGNGRVVIATRRAAGVYAARQTGRKWLYRIWT
jgi:DNA invertase Pin-like site-specific DNA recombinase